MSGRGRAMASGIQFGPNRNGKLYISIFIHRGTNRSKYKNKWHPSVPPPMEYDIFCKADFGNWRDSRGHYWGVHDAGSTVLGCQGERLCKFPQTINASDPWHGYPVSPLWDGDNSAPPDDFVEYWIATRVVTNTFGRRIQRRKV